MAQLCQTSHGKVSGWVIDSVVDHTINISKYNPLAASSHIKLPKELTHPEKSLINIQNFDDDQCFKWFLIRYLHPAGLTESLKVKWILKI